MAMQPEIEIKVRIEGLVAERIIQQQELMLGILGNMFRVVEQIKHEVTKMGAAIVTRDQFDQALQSGITTIVSKIDDLAAKVAAGTVTTPEDFSAELSTLQTAVSEALSKDPDPAPPTDGSAPTT